MQTETKTTKYITLIGAFILGAAIVYFSVSQITENRFQVLESDTRLLISEQEAILATIAEITARNGADSVTEQIVQDCSISERTAFDTLLGGLNDGLSQIQLIELERLFGRCGGFYAERKAMMVARLAREIEVYQTYVRQLETIIDADVEDEFFISQWTHLAEQEQKQSELFSELVRKQDEIIAALLAGKSADSLEIVEILRDVQEIQDTLTVTNIQTANVREELNSF
jgi:plasmid maintenance system killer protein